MNYSCIEQVLHVCGAYPAKGVAEHQKSPCNF